MNHTLSFRSPLASRTDSSLSAAAAVFFVRPEPVEGIFPRCEIAIGSFRQAQGEPGGFIRTETKIPFALSPSKGSSLPDRLLPDRFDRLNANGRENPGLLRLRTTIGSQLERGIKASGRSLRFVAVRPEPVEGILGPRRLLLNRVNRLNTDGTKSTSHD